MPLAFSDVGVEVVECLHVHRFKPGDQREALDFLARQSNAIPEAKHVPIPKWLAVAADFVSTRMEIVSPKHHANTFKESP